MDLERISEALNRYLRPQTFPVAIKLVNSENEIPQKARMPKRDLKIPMPVCQDISIARYTGWVVAMELEDMLCPFGALVLGFLPDKDKSWMGASIYPFG
jgi:uncharacterized protein (DUF169 family)